MCFDCHCLLLEYVVNDGDYALQIATSGGERADCPACRLVDSSLVGRHCNIVSFYIFSGFNLSYILSCVQKYGLLSVLIDILIWFVAVLQKWWRYYIREIWIFGLSYMVW